MESYSDKFYIIIHYLVRKYHHLPNFLDTVGLSYEEILIEKLPFKEALFHLLLRKCKNHGEIANWFNKKADRPIKPDSIRRQTQRALKTIGEGLESRLAEVQVMQ